MGESGKNILIMILVILTTIFFISTVSSCINSRRQKADRDKEMALRMDLEEKVSRFAQEKTRLEDKIKELDRLIQEEKKAHEVTKKALSEEQLVNKSLRDELEKITKLKEILENNLKEALVNKPSKSQK